MPTLEDAIAFAAHAHSGQVYPSPDGESYILHPLRVMLQLETEGERIVAVLHDIVEDTPYTHANLREAGYQDDILDAIDRLTQRENESYEQYIDRVAQNSTARRVKLADLSDNLANNQRLNALKPNAATGERIARYERAMQRLIAAATPTLSARESVQLRQS